MFGVLLDVDVSKPEDIFTKIGSKVSIEFVKANDDVHVPYWKLAS